MSTKHSNFDTYIDTVEDLLIDESFYDSAEFILRYPVRDDCPPPARTYITALADLLGDRKNINDFVAYLAKIEMENDNAKANG